MDFFDRFAATRDAEKILTLEDQVEILRSELFPKLDSVKRYQEQAPYCWQYLSQHVDNMRRLRESAILECGIKGTNPDKHEALECAHDLDEIGMYHDINAFEVYKNPKLKHMKKEQSQQTVKKLALIYGDWIYDLWREAEECKTPEAKLTHIFDKAESTWFILNVAGGGAGPGVLTREEADFNIRRTIKSLDILDKNDTELLKIKKFIGRLLEQAEEKFQKSCHEWKPDYTIDSR